MLTFKNIGFVFCALTLVLSLLLAACGDNPTTAPAATTAPAESSKLPTSTKTEPTKILKVSWTDLQTKGCVWKAPYIPEKEEGAQTLLRNCIFGTFTSDTIVDLQLPVRLNPEDRIFYALRYENGFNPEEGILLQKEDVRFNLEIRNPHTQLLVWARIPGQSVPPTKSK